MASEIEAQYELLKKKYSNLPNFKEIDFEFEISLIEKTNFLLRVIISKMIEKVEFFSTVLEEVLQPDTSNLYAMHECRFFDDEEKKRMYSLYTRLMNLNRHSIELALSHNEKEEADFISSLIVEWLGLKKELMKIIKKMRASWKDESAVKEELGYLG